ncbi:hypothetical protein [Luteipulveratus mongoliensis]|uniref:hypothetical protein n=1 Tax=Luteipulveratus mongoliensis TaxID=571913 RepID=UPI0012ED2B7C|nr:hypothetical protein [Luteipulveratus mongoliensis]
MPEPKFWDEDTSAPVHGPAIADVAPAAAAPTKAEFDALATKFNAALATLRSAGLIAQD